VDSGLRKYGNAERRQNLEVIQNLTRKNQQLEFRKTRRIFEEDTRLEVKDGSRARDINCDRPTGERFDENRKRVVCRGGRRNC
jgi:hypothetical protein